MRKDENGEPCPSTLGEYRLITLAIFGEENPAVKMLDKKIEEEGEDSEVAVSDLEMRRMLFSLGVEDLKNKVHEKRQKEQEQ